MSFLKTQWKKQLPIGIFTGIVFYFVDKCFWLYRQCVGNSLFDKLGVMFLHLELLFYHWYPSLYLTDLLGGFAGAAIFLVYFRYRKLNAKKFRKGEEYGSARWGNEKDIAPFIDPVFENNILFTMTERLTMNGRPKLPKYARNKNVLVIGGSGSGKTRFYLKPNLMQMPEKVKELRDLLSYDELQLDLLGDQKSAFFVIISDTDDTFNFVVAIMYTQLFNLLCERADDVYNGRLPYHVRLLLDEFSNIGHIPKWDKLIATIRSREISASIILQSKSQLKTMYKDAAETIIGNCDSTLFLGGKEESTLKEISEILGKETIDLYNTSDTRGNSRSYGLNYQKTGKELMSKDELSVMDGDKCILQIRGVRPFLSNKFDITKHKRYKELADYDAGNLFDIEAYLKHELRLYMNEMFDFMECSVTPEEIEKLKTEQESGYESIMES